jgi:hypothetical protein
MANPPLGDHGQPLLNGLAGPAIRSKTHRGTAQTGRRCGSLQITRTSSSRRLRGLSSVPPSISVSAVKCRLRAVPPLRLEGWSTN